MADADTVTNIGIAGMCRRNGYCSLRTQTLAVGVRKYDTRENASVNQKEDLFVTV